MAATIVYSTLMVLLSNSNEDFEQLWHRTDAFGTLGFNDLHSNKADMPIRDAIAGGNCRSYNLTIDEFEVVSIYGMNKYGDVLWETEFNVTGLTSTGTITSWLRTENVIFSSHQTLDDTVVVFNDSNYRFRIGPANELGEAWFAVTYNGLSYGPLPQVFAASSAYNPFDLIDVKYGYQGCWNLNALNFTIFNYSDPSMIPDTCIEACWDQYDVALVVEGSKCYCGLLNPTPPTDQGSCPLQCSTSQPCGGFGGGVGSAYHVQGNNLPGALRNKHLYSDSIVGSMFNVITISHEYIDGYNHHTDEAVFVDRVAVETNVTTHSVWFSLRYSTYYNCTLAYDIPDAFSYAYNDDSVWFKTSKSQEHPVGLLQVRCILILLNESVTFAKVKLYGPEEEDHIEVPVVAVIGKEYVEVPTTTTPVATTTTPTAAVTTSTTTTTTDPPTTTSSTTTTPLPTTSTTSTSTSTITNTSSTTSTSTSTQSPSTILDTTSTTAIVEPTPSSSVTSSTSTQTTTSQTCQCPCNETGAQVNYTSEELQAKIESIQKQLAVNVSSLSSTVRKLTSAEDARPSAQGIGFMGIAIIGFMLAAIVFMDSAMLVRDVRKLFNNVKNGLCCSSKE